MKNLLFSLFFIGGNVLANRYQDPPADISSGTGGVFWSVIGAVIFFALIFYEISKNTNKEAPQKKDLSDAAPLAIDPEEKAVSDPHCRCLKCGRIYKKSIFVPSPKGPEYIRCPVKICSFDSIASIAMNDENGTAQRAMQKSIDGSTF